MKTTLFFAAFVLCSVIALSNKVTVTNAGFTFSPDSISIHTNDTVVFQLSTIHSVVEVSEGTWLANGNTPLPGFSLPLGGGELTGFTTGIHYYVCGIHFAMGMKGRIFVTSGLGIAPPETGGGKIAIYPNPTSGKFSFSYKETAIAPGIFTADIYNILGTKILSQSGLEPQTSYEIDLTTFPDGLYFLRISDGLKSNTVRILKR
jgi:plastocyanin